MFDAISGRYDALNRLLSAGLDRRWRRQAIDALQLTGIETLADICTGTADLAIAAGRPRGARRVVGVDFAMGMLAIGREKVRRAGLRDSIVLVRGDAAQLPLQAASVEAATVAFGIRNVQHPAAACAELRRVLKPGGRVAILEFGIPTLPIFRSLYLWYFRVLLPRVGGWISRHESAYAYLPASVGAFPSPAEFADLMRAAGFVVERIAPLAGGIVYLYVATSAPVRTTATEVS
jgi:demethylmenaquinone methyltransferase/2-methoxy-6-polyprenyl-1,4-benzoquinol methylase